MLKNKEAIITEEPPKNIGPLSTISLTIPEYKPPPWGVVSSGQSVTGEAYSGDKTADINAWNQLLKPINTCFTLLRTFETNAWSSNLNEIVFFVHNDVMSGSDQIVFKKIKQQLNEDEPDSTITRLLNIIPTKPFQAVTKSERHYDPIAELTQYNLKKVIDAATYRFLSAHGVVTILTQRDTMTEILYSAVNSLFSLANAQRPYWIFNWACKSQQKIYEDRIMLLNKRQQEISNLRSIMDLFILSAMGSTQIGFNKENIAQCHEVAEDTESQLDMSKSQSSLLEDEMKNINVEKIITAISQKLPKTQHHYYQQIADLYNRFQDKDGEPCKIPKIDVRRCIAHIYERQLSSDLEHWILLSPLDFYVATLLPQVAIPVLDDECGDEEIMVMRHLVLLGYRARYNPDILLISIFAAIANNELSYDISTSSCQTEKITVTKHIINTNLKILSDFDLNEKQQAAIVLIRKLINGTLKLSDLGDPIYADATIIGYKCIEKILSDVLTKAHLQILSDRLNKEMTVTILLQHLFQRLLRADLCSRYEKFKDNQDVSNAEPLATRLKLAAIYLHNSDPLLREVDEAAQWCLLQLKQILHSKQFLEKDGDLMAERYRQLALCPEKYREFNDMLCLYLQHFTGCDLSLFQLFMRVGVPVETKVWPTDSASHHYFSKVIQFYFKGDSEHRSAIEGENEAKYFTVFKQLFTSYASHTIALREIFQDQLTNFYQTYQFWLWPILKCNEAFLKGVNHQQKIRSTLFLKLFNEANNARELGEYISTISEHHSGKNFSSLITPAAKKEFSLKLQQQRQEIQGAKPSELINIITNEKWLTLLNKCFPEYATPYIIDLLQALIKIATATVVFAYFKLLVTSLVGQLLRKGNNRDKIMLAEKVDHLFDDDLTWDKNIALLIKHFGSVKLELAYYYRSMVALMKCNDAAAISVWQNQIFELYSIQTIQGFKHKVAAELLQQYELYVESEFPQRQVSAADIVFAQVADCHVIKQKVFRQRLANIFAPCDASQQITQFLIVKNIFDEEKLYPHFEKLGSLNSQNSLAEIFDDVDFFIEMASDYVNNAAGFNSNSVAMVLLCQFDLQNLLPDEQQSVLRAYVEAEKKDVLLTAEYR